MRKLFCILGFPMSCRRLGSNVVVISGREGDNRGHAQLATQLGSGALRCPILFFIRLGNRFCAFVALELKLWDHYWQRHKTDFVCTGNVAAALYAHRVGKFAFALYKLRLQCVLGKDNQKLYIAEQSHGLILNGSIRRCVFLFFFVLFFFCFHNVLQ